MMVELHISLDSLQGVALRTPVLLNTGKLGGRSRRIGCAPQRLR